MENKKSFPKPLLIILIVLAFIFVISFILCISGGLLFRNAVSDEITKKETSKKSTNDTSSDNTKDTEKKEDYDLTNDLFKNNDFSLKLGKIEPNFKEKYMSLKEGQRVVRIPVTFENLSTVDMYTDSFKAKVDNQMVEEYYSSDDTIICEELLSGTKKVGAVYYKIPNNSTTMILVYDYGFWTDKKVEFKIDVTLQ